MIENTIIKPNNPPKPQTKLTESLTTIKNTIAINNIVAISFQNLNLVDETFTIFFCKSL